MEQPEELLLDLGREQQQQEQQLFDAVECGKVEVYKRSSEGRVNDTQR